MSTPDRTLLAKARRVVIKIGSRALVQRTGRPDLRRLRELVRQVSALRAAGREVVVVSSGAIACGMEALGLSRRPTDVAGLQMAAAVGQSRLMATYDRLFARHGLRAAQILLTHADLKDRVRHLNARATMVRLLEQGIVPVVNENDVVAVDEIKFGDNDLLASLVSLLLEADSLILLTTVDGLRAPATGGRTRRIPLLSGITEDVLGLAQGKGSELSTGGMLSKLQSASMVVASGIPVVIANGRTDGIVQAIMNGEDRGTFIAPGGMVPRSLQSHRKRWIAFFHKTPARIEVDDGAREALLRKGSSLLPIGVRSVQGEFQRGEVVSICGTDGIVIARGLVQYSSEELSRVRGRRLKDLRAERVDTPCAEVVHRDNLVLLSTPIENEGVDV